MTLQLKRRPQVKPYWHKDYMTKALRISFWQHALQHRVLSKNKYMMGCLYEVDPGSRERK